MTTKVRMQKEEVLTLIGNPKKVGEELQSFRRAAKVFSSKHLQLIDRYPKQWIAVHQGRVKACGRTFNRLLINGSPADRSGNILKMPTISKVVEGSLHVNVHSYHADATFSLTRRWPRLGPRVFQQPVKALMDEIERQGLPRTQLLVRFVDKVQRTMIL